MYNHRTHKESEEERSINPCIMHFMYLHCKLNVQKNKMKRNPSLECIVGTYDLFNKTKGPESEVRGERHMHTPTRNFNTTENKNASAKRKRDRFSKILLDL